MGTAPWLSGPGMGHVPGRGSSLCCRNGVLDPNSHQRWVLVFLFLVLFFKENSRKGRNLGVSRNPSFFLTTVSNLACSSSFQGSWR